MSAPNNTAVICAAAVGASALTWLLMKPKGRVVVEKNGSAFYSATQTVNGIVYCSGQVGKLAEGGMAPGGVYGECVQALSRMKMILEDSGSSMDRVIKTICYLADMSDYGCVCQAGCCGCYCCAYLSPPRPPATRSEFNKAYVTVFADPKTRPARVCFAVKGLPMNALCEIECTAFQ